MAKQDTIRTKLQNKVFNVYGKTIVLSHYTATTTDTRGDVVVSAVSTSTILAVPYNIVGSRQTYQSFGTINEGEMDCAIPYNVTISTSDLLNIENANWVVKEIAPNYLPDNVVTIVRLQKQQS